jgi:hypothetical protein
MTEASSELHAALRPHFKGELIRPADISYESARAVWNGVASRYPLLIARCANVSDVQLAVRAASRAGILTAIRCGGHSLAGFSTCDGLVIDLSGMREVRVDPERRRASVGGGCLLGSIDSATQKAGLVFPSGVVSHTGAGGLILGGGTGWLTRRFGLSCDNVNAFELVTATGSIVSCHEKNNPGLFWALRGGGGNFGVVTEFEVRLHPLTSVVFGEGLCAAENVSHLLRSWRDLMAEAPVDLKWNVDLRLAPHTENVPTKLRGQPVASSSMVWTGDPEGGRPYLQHALSLCEPGSVRCRVMSYLELQTMADSAFPHGRRYYTKSGYFAALDEATIGRLAGALERMPSSETQIELAYLGGAAAQVAADDTAFGDRSAPFIINLLANWPDASADAVHISWVRGVFNQLRPAMRPGVYVNFMSGDEQERVPEAYHVRWDRLVAVKSHYDPKNFFRLNQNIPPQRI